MGLFSKNKNEQSGGGKFSGSFKDSKQTSSIIINSIDDAIILIDNSNVIQNFNPGAAKLTGWTEEEAMGIDLLGVVKIVDETGQPYKEFENPMVKVFNTMTNERDTKANIQRKDNAIIAVDVSVAPIIDAQNHISGAVAVIRNVDEQRRAEKQSAEFISTASHEMRTPVAAIEGYLALAMNDKVCKIDEKARSYLDKAHASTDHLGKLFQDLLTSAKAEDGRLSSHPKPVNMSEYVESLVDDLRFSAEKKGLTLELIHGAHSEGGQTISPLYYVMVDPDRIREVITNLFDNAVKYTETGGISIGITGDQNIVQFYIRDTGPGIPKEDVPHLFQKFYRVDNSATRTIGGTGLGLFICQKIVELYKGKIWVESEVNKGSTFYINLPRLDTMKAQSEIGKAAGPQVINDVERKTEATG